MLSTCGQFESRKTNVVLFFSFKLNTNSFIRSIYYYMYVLEENNSTTSMLEHLIDRLPSAKT